MSGDTLCAPPSVPFCDHEINPASEKKPRAKRKKAVNPIPLEQRTLIDVPDAGRLMSVSYRTAKRIAAEHPELTALVGKRRLFIRAKLLAWLEAGGHEKHGRR